MANRQLTIAELENLARPLLADVRKRLTDLAAGDASLLWALRRKLAKELTYDERGKTMHRVSLKKLKRKQQEDHYAICKGPLAPKGTVLDRLEAMSGYTEANTRVLCASCDTKVQTERGYK